MISRFEKIRAAANRRWRLRRGRTPRAKSIKVKQLTRREIEIGRLLYPVVDIERPQTRGECREAERPCPWIACKHHLYLDVSADTGTIKINFPDLEPWELSTSCSLDVAERGGVTLEEIGEAMNLTRERVRQVELIGSVKLRAACMERGIDDEALAHFPHPEAA